MVSLVETEERNDVDHSLSNNKPIFFFQIIVACFKVFTTWDDEYEKLEGRLRDVVRRKREKGLKMVWRVNPTHKRLQARLDQMRK